VKNKIFLLCRQLSKPATVCSQLFEYMVDTVPTGFKFAGASGEVGQQANGLMLSDRSAMDQFPENALAVLRTVGFEN
jgi:pyruvate kinase